MSEATFFMISGLTLFWLLIRAFFKWVDVREQAPGRSSSLKATAPQERTLQ